MTEILRTTAGHSGFAGVAGPNHGSMMMTMMMTKIHGRFATVPRHHAAAGAGGHLSGGPVKATAADCQQLKFYGANPDE